MTIFGSVALLPILLDNGLGRKKIEKKVIYEQHLGFTAAISVRILVIGV